MSYAALANMIAIIINNNQESSLIQAKKSQ